MTLYLLRTLKTTPKAWHIKERISKPDFIKRKNFFSLKDTVNRIRRQATDRKYFKKTYLINVCYPNYTSEWVNEVAQSCLTLCDPMDCNLPASPVPGIFQARIPEWVAISFSRRSSRLRDWTRVSCIVDRCFTGWATRVQRNLKTQL